MIVRANADPSAVHVDDSPPDRLGRGKIFLIDGIGGLRGVPLSVGYSLRAVGIDHAMEEFYWSVGAGIKSLLLHDLTMLERNRAQAKILADRIRDYRRRHPQTPVHLIGHSGGTGIAAFALELLEPEHGVTSAVFMSSALSPDYDLTPALERTRVGVLAVNSAMDFLILGLGTTLFGTIDRRHRPAAGMLGFSPPSDDARTRAGYKRLKQVQWNPTMIGQLYFGDHLTVAGLPFVRSALADWIREAEQA